jgi:opacity protein-like surface antigen
MNGMRLTFSALALLGLVHNSQAADYGPLRGSDVFAPAPATYFRWSGFYAGGQAGYSNAQMNFSNAAGSLVAFVLRESTLESGSQISEWDVLGKADTRDFSYGGFVGYNAQFENAIVGIELNYNHGSIFGQSVGSLSRTVSPGDGLIYHTTVAAEASMNITDYGTVRARGGYAMGSFLPYVMVGLAVGRVDTFRSATITADVEDPNNPFNNFRFGPVTQSETKTNYVYGYSAGAGVDVAITHSLFLRGEVEWLQFTTVPNMEVNLITARAGAGFRF